MNTNATTSPTNGQPTQPTNKPSIAADRAYTQALSDLIAVEVAASTVEEFTADFDTSPAFTAAQQATGAAWDALAAVVDAWAARQ